MGQLSSCITGPSASSGARDIPPHPRLSRPPIHKTYHCFFLQMSSEVKVAYVCSSDLARISSLLPSNRNRSALVHTLVNAYGLLKRPNCRLVKPAKASRRDLERYHEAGYLDYVLQPHQSEVTSKGDVTEFGLEDDCEVFPGLDEYMYVVAGATLTATKAIQSAMFDVAICWDGGRHHAHKAHAAGFCYVADCVLCILQLRRLDSGQKGRPKVAYLDLDLHHGDGVAEAFTSRSLDDAEIGKSTVEESASPSNILTLSVHHHAPGFYPHSALGSLTKSITKDPFSLSIPLGRGTGSHTYARIWSIIERVLGAFFCWDQVERDESPTYLVVQCGVDGLAGDPYAVWNWDIDVERDGSLGWCVQKAMEWVGARGKQLKIVFLGGGGYNSPNAARAWTYLTSIITGHPLSVNDDIPDHGSFLQYAPSFVLDVPAGNRPDENTEKELSEIESSYDVLIERIRCVQSV
ncbi:histone deacetylase family protein [Rhizoctonia solani AG-3 Rhs1AP]|uniref:Histone deacetylase 8 n=1 Tax=Rhizoctonia solani AG-3 Rhs1AP TaxID=1086054 RepID=X8J043_9AGAM|nr:histone deacetylase family protein [Rhizoctonia solani AG-3 Rhs1AP]